MPLIYLKGSLLLDLNAPDPSERVPIIGPQCLQVSKRFQLQSYVESKALASRGGSGGVSPQEEVTAATATASQQLSPFGRTSGQSRPGTKYPVREIPHFDVDVNCLLFWPHRPRHVP